MLELGIFVSPYAQENVKRKTLHTLYASGITHRIVTPTDTDLPYGIVAIGGDGTAHLTANTVFKRPEEHLILTVPGGTANTLDNSLRHSNNTLSFRQLLDNNFSHLRQVPVGQVGNDIFISMAAFGPLPFHYASIVNDRREFFIPRRPKAYIAGAVGYVFYLQNQSSLDSPDVPTTDLFFLGSHVGKLSPTLDEKIFTRELERIRIDAKTQQGKFRAFLQFLHYCRYHEFSRDLSDVVIGESFTVTHGNKVVLDGETVKLNEPSSIVVRKSDKPLLMAALKL